MNLSQQTMEILSNFSEINSSILLKKGNVQRTVSPMKSILAQAKISEDLPSEAPIFDLKQLIQAVNMFEDADVSFNDNNLRVKNGKAYASIFYASRETIVTPPDKDIKLPSSEVSFVLDQAAFSSALRAASVFNLPEIVLLGEKGTAYLTAVDSKNSASNFFRYPVGESDVNYNMIFKVENLKLLPRDYDVRISSKGISHFASKTGDVEYWIAVETGSKYGE